MKILVEYDTGDSEEYYCGNCQFLQAGADCDGKCGITGHDLIYYDGFHRERSCYVHEFQAQELEILRQIEIVTRNIEIKVGIDPHGFSNAIHGLKELREKLETARSEKDFNAFDDCEPEYDFSNSKCEIGKYYKQYFENKDKTDASTGNPDPTDTSGEKRI